MYEKCVFLRGDLLVIFEWIKPQKKLLKVDFTCLRTPLNFGVY